MSFVAGSKYDVTMLVASVMPAMPLPCADAEMFAASRRAARMICFFFNVFVIIVSFFVPPGWIVPLAVDTCFTSCGFG